MREPSADVRGTAPVFGTLALLSGLCALGYEVLYLRHLTTLLGDMVWVHAALLSTFLLGVGAGARLAHRAHRWLAAFEVSVGLYAIALPHLTPLLGRQPWMAAVARSAPATVLLTLALVAVPAVCIGFGLPLFSAYVKTSSGGRARAFAGVYGLYNLGAFAGILLVELILVRTVGLHLSLTALGAINLAIGVGLSVSGSARIPRPAVPRRSFPRRTVIALVLASAASASFQMFLLKSIDLTFTPHRENFAVGLSVILLGIAMGASIGARRRVRFVSLLVLVPAAVGVSFLFVTPARELAAPFALTVASPAVAFGTKLLWSGVLGLVPMVLFGALVPALLHEERAVAEESGHLLWLSALGNAAGYLLFVALLHPRLSGAGVLVVVGAAALGAAWIAAGGLRERWKPVAVGAAALAVLLGTWNDPALHLGVRWSAVDSADTVRVFKWGGESATLVRRGGEAWVSYNGHPSISVSVGGRVNLAEVVSGVVPALAAPRTDRALVLGLGTGITAGSAARVFRSVDVAEINRAFIDMTPLLSAANQRVAEQPNVTIHHTDGRSFLVGRRGAYDAIVNSIPAPTYYSASKIYTVEFYELVNAALAEDGVFATWLSPREMSEAGLETVLRTLSLSFERCDLWLLDTGYYMATCGDGAREPRRFSALPQDSSLLGLLGEAIPGLVVEEYLADIRLADDVLASHAPGAAINSDDFPVLEFQVMGRSTAPVLDPFVADPGRFAIDPGGAPGGEAPDRVARRAYAYAGLDDRLFQVFFGPLFERDDVLRRAYDAVARSAR